MPDGVKILITDKLSEEGLAILKGDSSLSIDYSPGISGTELFNKLPLADAIIIRTATIVNAEFLSHCNVLKLICRVGVGTDNIDIKACSLKGIVVMNTPRGNRISTAEHAVAMMFAVARSIPQGTAALKSGHWDREKFSGVELFGKTLSIIGLGNIGREVAKRAMALGMNVIAFDPYLPPQKAFEIKVKLLPLTEVLESGDFVSLHVPLTNETSKFVSHDFLKKMKKTSFLINTSRGAVVDENALLEMIEGNRLAGAALDVFSKEPLEKNSGLLKTDKIILTPHIAGQTRESMTALSQEAAYQVQSFFRSGTIIHSVNQTNLSEEDAIETGPVVKLAEEMGLLAGQWLEGQYKSIKIEHHGSIDSEHLSLISNYFLKGLLSKTQGLKLNSVNSRIIAETKGIKLTETLNTLVTEYHYFMGITVATASESLYLGGTFFGKSDARIVQINNLKIDLEPQGNLLAILTKNMTSAMAVATNVFAKNNVVISGLYVGFDKKSADSMIIFKMKDHLDIKLMGQLIEWPEINFIKQLTLD